MEAKELMIGDWVLDKNVSDKPVQVLQINYKNVYYKHGTGYMSAGVELLEPIPLTAEFFDSNGWQCIESEKYGKRYGLYDDYYEMTAHEFNDGMWRVEYDCIEMGGIPIECVNVGWVHEFQHFLGHCAVEAEIKLEG
jgi:hypothetical protein